MDRETVPPTEQINDSDDTGFCDKEDCPDCAEWIALQED